MECKVRKLWRKFLSGTKAAYPTFLPSVELMPSRPVLNWTWVVDQLLVFLSCFFLKTVLLKKNLAHRLLTKLTWYVFVVVALINTENNRLMSFFSFGCIYAFSFREVFQKTKRILHLAPAKLSFLSPLIIGSKLSFSGYSDRWLSYSALFRVTSITICT